MSYTFSSYRHAITHTVKIMKVVCMILFILNAPLLTSFLWSVFMQIKKEFREWCTHDTDKTTQEPRNCYFSPIIIFLIFWHMYPVVDADISFQSCEETPLYRLEKCTMLSGNLTVNVIYWPKHTKTTIMVFNLNDIDIKVSHSAKHRPTDGDGNWVAARRCFTHTQIPHTQTLTGQSGLKVAAGVCL